MASLPGGCQVRLLNEPALTLPRAGARSVVLPLERAQGALRLELTRPGYEPLIVEVEAERLVETGRLPLEEGKFYRLQPRQLQLTVASEPDGADVYWEGRRVGTAGQPFAFNLGTLAEMRRARFTLKLPGYRDETLTTTLDQLEKNPTLGTVKLQPLFPGAAPVAWLARHPTVAWIALAVTLAVMAYQIRRLLRTPGAR